MLKLLLIIIIINYFHKPDEAVTVWGAGWAVTVPLAAAWPTVLVLHSRPVLGRIVKFDRIPNTKYIRILKIHRIPNTEYIRFLKNERIRIPNSAIQT